MSEKNIFFRARCQLPTPWAVFDLHGFEDVQTGKEHLALVLGEINPQKTILLRLHSECMTGDTLFSLRCDCGAQLEKSIRMIAEHGSGVVLYLRQEGRGIGLVNKIRAYQLQDQGLDTVEANRQLGFEDDQRTYEFCKEMLESLGVKKVTLMSNNPRKISALKNLGFKVERAHLVTAPNRYNERYLTTKKFKLGHLFGLTDTTSDCVPQDSDALVGTTLGTPGYFTDCISPKQLC